jgi:hypothetical protein
MTLLSLLLWNRRSDQGLVKPTGLHEILVGMVGVLQTRNPVLNDNRNYERVSLPW